MDTDISHLHPELIPLCKAFLSGCKSKGINVKVIFTYRSPDEQNALYAQGRTAPGKIVTNAKGGKSKHNFTLNGIPASKAFDFGVYINGKYITDGKHPLYSQAGSIGESLGLVWGGHFHSIFDPSHLELKE